MTARWRVAAVLMALPPAATAGPAQWQVGLAALARPDAAPTIATLGAMLEPLGGVSISVGCKVTLGARRPGAPGLAAMSLDAPSGCVAGAMPARVQLLLHPIDGDAVATLRQDVQRLAGPPCFDGTYTGNSRRRAPPLRFVAWSGPERDLVLTQDASLPDGLSMTFMRNDLHMDDAAAMASYAETRDAAHHVLPTSCRAGK